MHLTRLMMLYVFVILIAFQGCDLIEEELSETSSSSVNSSSSSSQVDINVTAGPVLYADVEMGGSDCEASSTDYGTYTCTDNNGEIAVKYMLNDSTFQLIYCDDDDCTQTFELNSTSSTTFMKAPKGSRKVDSITHAIYTVMQNMSLSEASAISYLNSAFVGTDSNTTIDTDYLTNNTFPRQDNPDLAKVNVSLQSAMQVYEQTGNGISDAINAYEVVHAIVDGYSTTSAVETALVDQLETNSSLRSSYFPTIPSAGTSSVKPLKLPYATYPLSVGSSVDIAVESNGDSLSATSSATSVATVSADVSAKTITITGVSAGTASITVSNGTLTRKMTVVVSESLTLSSSSVSVTAGSTKSVTYSSGSGTVSATSNDTSVATVAVNSSSSSLTITGVSAGTTTISVTNGTATKTLSVTVTSSSSTSTLTLSSSSANVTAGSTTSVTYSSSSGTVTADSSDTSVATVSVGTSSVTITGVAAGSTTITVTNGTDSETISVTVTSSSTSGSFTITNVNTPTVGESTSDLTTSLSGTTFTIDFGSYKISDTSITTIYTATYGPSSGTISSNTASFSGTTVTISGYNTSSDYYLYVVTNAGSTSLKIVYE